MIGDVYEQVDEHWMVLVVGEYTPDGMPHRPCANILVLWDKNQPKYEGNFEVILIDLLESTCVKLT